MDFKKIKLLALDVDGVLTDGKLHIGPNGEMEKIFSVLDGMAISVALRNGLKIAIVTGRGGNIVQFRAKELGITDCYTGVTDKKEKLQDLMADYELKKEEVAYMGDDLNDLPCMTLAGNKFAPCNGVAEVKAVVDYVTETAGGYGAVREVIEKILTAQGKWQRVVESYKQQGQGDRQ